MEGEVVLTLRLFAYGSPALMPDLILDATVNPRRPEYPPTPAKQSIRKYLIQATANATESNQAATNSINEVTESPSKKLKTIEITTPILEPIKIKEEPTEERSNQVQNEQQPCTSSTQTQLEKEKTKRISPIAKPPSKNPRLNIPLTDLHIRRLIKPDVRLNEEADPTFDRIRDGANNIYLRVKEGSLSYYYVLTRNEAVIRQNKCMVIQYQELTVFFVHVQNVSEKFRQLYKYLIGTLGNNRWIPLLKYTNVFITSNPMPTRYHYTVLSQLTQEAPDNVFA